MGCLRVAAIFVFLGVSGLVYGESLKESLGNIKFSGAVGTYMESRHFDEEGMDYNWGTAYLKLKAETAPFLNLKLGVAGLSHNELWEDSDSGRNYYDVDIEEELTLSELYGDLALFKEAKSKVLLGRLPNKGTHIDDSHHEGWGIIWKEWDAFSFRLGGFRKYAELDYDDGEDYGRQKGTQELDHIRTFGERADSWAYYIETQVKTRTPFEFNPYVYIHDGYANVLGVDSTLKWKRVEGSYGALFNVYFVDADSEMGLKDGEAFHVAPFYKWKPYSIEVGWLQLNGGEGDEALNKPNWLKDYLHVSDQMLSYNSQDSRQDMTSTYLKLKYKKGSFWFHFILADYDYSMSRYGTGYQELEVQANYNFACGIDFNLRFFDIDLDGEGSKAVDYYKFESRIRYKFSL